MKKKKEARADVCLPLSLLCFGLALAAGGVALSIASMKFGDWLLIPAVILTVLGLAAGLCWKNQKIEMLPGGEFRYTTFLGHSREYRFSDITDIRYNGDSTTIFVGKKKIHIESMAIVSSRFENRLYSALSSIPKADSDLQPKQNARAKVTASKSNKNARADVYYKPTVLIGGIACIVLGAAAVVLTGDLLLRFIIVAFEIALIAIGVLLCLMWKNRKIVIVSSDVFEYTNAFGRTTEYRFSDIDDVMISGSATMLIIGDKKLAFGKSACTGKRMETKLGAVGATKTFDSRTTDFPDAACRFKQLLLIWGSLFILFAVLVVDTIISPDDMSIYEPCIFLILSVYEILSCKNQRIVMLSEEEFEYRNTWGRKTVYRFDAITEFYTDRYSATIYIGKKKLRLSSWAYFSTRFIKRLERALNEQQNQESEYEYEDEE